jgi:hypothetical protein
MRENVREENNHHINMRVAACKPFYKHIHKKQNDVVNEQNCCFYRQEK